MQVCCKINFVGEGVRPSETLSSRLNLRRGQKAPWSPSFSLAVRILLLVRFSAAIHSNNQDADEATRCNLQLETCPHVFSSVQLLGDAYLVGDAYLDRGHGFQTWETSPEHAIRNYAYIALHVVSVKNVPLWRPKGMTDRIGRLTADRFCPSESPSLLCADPFLSYRPYARRNSIGWSLRTSIGV